MVLQVCGYYGYRPIKLITIICSHTKNLRRRSNQIERGHRRTKEREGGGEEGGREEGGERERRERREEGER